MAFNRFHNNITSNGSSAIELIVQSRPVIETTYSKLAAEIDQAVTLACRVSGQPMPNIYWKLQERIISCDEITDETCYLRLPRMRPTDFGSYRCIAENLLGREEWVYTIVSRGENSSPPKSELFREVELLVSGKPETPTDIEVSDMTASSFQIRFAPSFDGGNGSQRFFVQVTDLHNSSSMKQELPPNTYQHTIKGKSIQTLVKEKNVYLTDLHCFSQVWMNQLSIWFSCKRWIPTEKVLGVYQSLCKQPNRFSLPMVCLCVYSLTFTRVLSVRSPSIACDLVQFEGCLVTFWLLAG